jgi:hypothetical protein
MFAFLPITFIFSLLLWGSVLFTLMGCAQLILFERIIKSENGSTLSYKDMTSSQKKGLKKIGLKVAIGLISLIFLAVVDHFLIIK